MEQQPVYLCGGNLAQHYEPCYHCHPARDNAEMHLTVANLQREVQKWRELYFASRLQSERGVKLLQDAKELIVKLEDEARKMSN